MSFDYRVRPRRPWGGKEQAEQELTIGKPPQGGSSWQHSLGVSAPGSSHLHWALTDINAAEGGRSSTDCFPKALLQTAARRPSHLGRGWQGDYWRCPWPHAAEQGNFIPGKDT